jgi:hypothetical protein
MVYKKSEEKNETPKHVPTEKIENKKHEELESINQ